MTVSRPKPSTAESIAPLPFKIVAPFSLNPRPRYISRVDFTTPFAVPE